MAKVVKEEVIKEFRIHETDTGSAEVQVALITKTINSLVEHLKVHRKDFHTQRGLLLMVGKRRRLLKYLKGKDLVKYTALTSSLSIKA